MIAGFARTCLLVAVIAATANRAAMALDTGSSATSGLTTGRTQTTGVNYMTTPSFQSIQTQAWNTFPQVGADERSRVLTKVPGGDRADTFQGTFAEPEVMPLTPSQPVQSGGPIPQSLQSAPQQPVVYPPQVLPFTLYSDDTGYPGPPSRPMPFLFIKGWASQSVGATLSPRDPSAGSVVDTGAPASSAVAGFSTSNSAQLLAGMLSTPQYYSSQAALQGGTQQMATIGSGASTSEFAAVIGQLAQGLINVANENAASPASQNAPTRTLQQVIWMVQQMYKIVFTPMGILLLLPGAIITQGSARVRDLFATPDDDSSSPFPGILRTIVAIFLIPATQLIVSFAIDTGNSLTYEIDQYINVAQLATWGSAISNQAPSGTPGQQQQSQDDQSTLAAAQSAACTMAWTMMEYAVLVLIALQTVLVCYLYLMGPIAAAFYCWPTAQRVAFRQIFPIWVNGVFMLVLWRFWWSLILLCMSARLQWLNELGYSSSDGRWEWLMYFAFMVMLTTVPFVAFDFRPGDLVDTLLQKAGLPTTGSDSFSSNGQMTPGMTGFAPQSQVTPTST